MSEVRALLARMRERYTAGEGRASINMGRFVLDRVSLGFAIELLSDAMQADAIEPGARVAANVDAYQRGYQAGYQAAAETLAKALLAETHAADCESQRNAAFADAPLLMAEKTAAFERLARLKRVLATEGVTYDGDGSDLGEHGIGAPEGGDDDADCDDGDEDGFALASAFGPNDDDVGDIYEPDGEP